MRSALALTALALGGVLGCGSGDGTDQNPESLIGQSFLSTGGEPEALVAEAEVSLTFRQRADRTLIGWEAGCNSYGAAVEVQAARLVVGGISGTEIGCPEPRHRQDELLAELFDSDPEWELTGDRLRLSADDAELELVRTGS